MAVGGARPAQRQGHHQRRHPGTRRWSEDGGHSVARKGVTGKCWRGHLRASCRQQRAVIALVSQVVGRKTTNAGTAPRGQGLVTVVCGCVAGTNGPRCCRPAARRWPSGTATGCERAPAGRGT